MVAAVSGCSLSLDGPKPNRPRGYEPKCDDSKGLVAADGLLATAVGIGALSAFGGDEPGAGVGLGLTALAFSLSAVHGNNVVNECRAEQARYAQEVPLPTAPPVPFDDDEPRIARAPRPRPAAPAAPAVPAAGTTPADPYADAPPPARPTTAPARPAAATATTTPTATPPAPPPAATTPAPADSDPAAWSDFWTEVP